MTFRADYKGRGMVAQGFGWGPPAGGPRGGGGGGPGARDTIVALSSGPGRGAIAVVRLSGPGTAEVLSRVFLPRRKSKRKAPPARRLVLGRFVDGEGRPFDEGLAAFMPGPDSFTGED